MRSFVTETALKCIRTICGPLERFVLTDARLVIMEIRA